VHNKEYPCEGNLQGNIIIEPIEEENNVTYNIVWEKPPLINIDKAIITVIHSSLVKVRHGYQHNDNGINRSHNPIKQLSIITNVNIYHGFEVMVPKKGDNVALPI
jgi:hypothetical protein